MYIFFHKNEGVKSICISLISLSRKLRSASFSFFGLANEKTRVVKNSKLKIHRVFLIFNSLLSTLCKKIREKREVRGRKNIFEVSLSRYKWSRKFFSDNEIRCLSRNLWCPGRDLNSYTVRQRLLRPSCLPIPPPGRDMMNLEVLSSTNSNVNGPKHGGPGRIRTCEVVDKGFTVLPIWPLWNRPKEKQTDLSS